MRKSKADLVRGWLEKARRDFNTAVNELNVVEPWLEDAKESIEIAKKVAHFVLQRLPAEARGGSDADSIRS